VTHYFIYDGVTSSSNVCSLWSYKQCAAATILGFRHKVDKNCTLLGYYAASRTQKRAVPYVQMQFLVFIWHFKDSTTLSRPPVGLQICFFAFIQQNTCWLYIVVESYIYLFLTHIHLVFLSYSNLPFLS